MRCSQLLSNGTTSQIAFAPSTVPNSPRRRVQFSYDALRSNLHELLSSHGPELVIDLRCDAYGFGTTWVRDAAEELGLSRFLTDDDPLAPVAESTRHLFGLTAGRAVATVIGEVVAVKTIDSGEPVSYGNTWVSTRTTDLALVSLGFADGMPRSGSNSAHVSVNGHESPIVGRIAMDQLVLDVTGRSVSVGDDACVWSTVDNTAVWSSATGRDPLSLVAQLSWRVEREWV